MHTILQSCAVGTDQCNDKGSVSVGLPGFEWIGPMTVLALIVVVAWLIFRRVRRE